MANTLAVQSVQPGDRARQIIYKVTLSGSYVQASSGTTTGEQLLFNSASNPNNLPFASFGAKGPDRCYPIMGPAGYSVSILPGATANQWLLKIYSAVGTELAAGAYPAAITGDGNILLAAEGTNF